MLGIIIGIKIVVIRIIIVILIVIIVVIIRVTIIVILIIIVITISSAYYVALLRQKTPSLPFPSGILTLTLGPRP